MDKTEEKCDLPSVDKSLTREVLDGNVRDAECDQTFDDTARYGHESERCESQRYAVSGSERCYDFQQRAERCRDNEQPREKCKMIVSGKDVLYAQFHEIPSRLKQGLLPDYRFDGRIRSI